MAVASVNYIGRTLTPFLYPPLSHAVVTSVLRQLRPRTNYHCRYSTSSISPNVESSHLNPDRESFSLTPFADRCIITLEAGAGGHGCVSFVREKYVDEGPANGGDGGSGGNIYIQAVRGETSLHKLARRRLVKAGRGRNGQGKMRGGERGADIVIQVPIGTIVREISRYDPIAEAEKVGRKQEWIASSKAPKEVESPEESEQALEGEGEGEEGGQYRKDKWLLFPGIIPSQVARLNFPALPKPRRSPLVALQPEEPVWLDLDKHMETPMLLVAGAMGGLGNPHFVGQSKAKPKMATKGEEGTRVSLQLELKLLADLGLVGLPNAGKSTLLRALSNSRARVGSWAFTTLQPNVGTVVLDNHKGRPAVMKRGRDGELRENFTIADVPGLIEDAHLDKGLGLGFLRHVERAATLAFVIDLSAGDAVATLKLLWNEVSEYEAARGKGFDDETERKMVTYKPPTLRLAEHADEPVDPTMLNTSADFLPELTGTPISQKPWFVVATKADLPETQANYVALQKYVAEVNAGTQPHPSSRKNAWKRDIKTVPVSAINAQGVDVIPQLVMDLLEE